MIIYKCHEIQHEADLGMGLRFIRKHRRYYLHHYAIRDNFDDVIKFNPEGGVVLAYAGRRGISQEVRDHITKLFRSWNSAVEPDWDSYYQSYLNRYTELRMKPIQTANPKYVLAD